MLDDKGQMIFELVCKLLYMMLWLVVRFGSIIAILVIVYAYIIKFIMCFKCLI